MGFNSGFKGLMSSHFQKAGRVNPSHRKQCSLNLHFLERRNSGKGTQYLIWIIQSHTFFWYFADRASYSYSKCVRSVVNRLIASTNIAGLNPQSPRHFAWKLSVHGLTNLTPPPTSVTWQQLLRNQTNTGTSTTLSAETHWPTRTWLCNISLVSQTLPAPEAGDFVWLTLRLLMSYIYIYIYGAPILDVSRSHTTTHHSR